MVLIRACGINLKTLLGKTFRAFANQKVPQGEFWSDEPPLESNLHLTQIILLIKCLEWLWQDREDYFATGNLTIYYSPNQKKSEYCRGPDFFVVLGTTRNQNWKSWVVWQEEGKYPNVIIEILF